MRRLYAFIAVVTLTAITLPTHARTFTPDVANFTFTFNTATGNVDFTNTSTLGNEPGERRALWSFGDGSSQWTGGLDGTQHHYQTAGTFIACLKIYRINPTTGDSIASTEVCKTIVIESVCQADFQTLNSTANALGKYFVAQPAQSQGKKPVLICWTFGDNHDTCIQYSTTYTGGYGVYHLYSQVGTYNVCVTIHYDGGCEAHTCHLIETNSPDSCHASFEIAPINSTPLGRYFAAQPWHNHNKKPLRICWTFGDNSDTCIEYSSTYTGTYGVYHSYNHPGNYDVCVNIHYDGGCEAQSCRTAQVGDTPDSCKANFERIPFTSIADPLWANFRALPWHNHNKKPQRICWSFGDNTDTCINYGTDYTGSYIVAHHYAHSGQYQVCVNILYYGGCEAHICKPIVIVPVCSVNVYVISPSATGLARLFYAFANSSSNQPVQQICWHFGDGTDTCVTATATVPPSLLMEHTYPAPGVYHACVRVQFAGGCVAENCVEVSITSTSHLCGGYMSDSMISPHEFKFKGYSIHQSNDPVLSYTWTFGDGSTGTGEVVTHSYAAGGEYRVCLTIMTQSGCETHICNTVRVPTGSNQSVLQLSPNPVVDVLHALFYSTHNETVTVRIINSSGVVVRTYTRVATIGANNWDFDLSSLGSGTYLFVIQSTTQTASALFVKL